MNKLYRTFGRFMRVERRKLGWSQVRLARRLRWPQTRLSRVETGEREVTLAELMEVAAVLRLPASELLVRLEGGPAEPAPSSAPGFSPGFYAALRDEETLLAQLGRFGVHLLGGPRRPALSALPLEETLLAALRSPDPRVFETLPALLLKNADRLDWTRLSAGAYALQLQNRLGMAVAAGLQLRDSPALRRAFDVLAEARLDREEVVGPPPKTREGRAFLRSRTPDWLRFWHGLGSTDLESLRRHLLP